MTLALRAAGIGSCILLLLSVPALAQVVVPANASFALNGGNLDLAGTGLQVAGAFSLGAGNVNNAANVAIASGGSLDGGSGTITLFGDWSNTGTFTAGTGSVNFVGGSVAQSNISGNSIFYGASFVSAAGKNYVFAVGATQNISSLLTITGTAALPIQFRSSAAGQVANIDLLPGGSQNIVHVGVSDMHATGQHLAASQTNEGGTGNADGWFMSGVNGGGNAVPTPTLSGIGASLLALLLAVFAAFVFPTFRKGE